MIFSAKIALFSNFFCFLIFKYLNFRAKMNFKKAISYFYFWRQNSNSIFFKYGKVWIFAPKIRPLKNAFLYLFSAPKFKFRIFFKYEKILNFSAKIALSWWFFFQNCLRDFLKKCYYAKSSFQPFFYFVFWHYAPTITVVNHFP